MKRPIGTPLHACLFLFFLLASGFCLDAQLPGLKAPPLPAAHDFIKPELEIPFMLAINGKPYGELETGILGDQAILEKSRIAPILLNYLRPDIYSVIFDSVFGGISWLTADDFASVGLAFSFNQSELTISIDIPPEYYPVIDIDFVPDQVYNYKPVLRPAPFSGWLQTDTSLRISATSWSSFYLSSRLSSMLDLHGTHLFGTANLTATTSKATFQPGDVYFIWDSRPIASQIWLGQFIPPGIANQTRTTIWGISAASSESQKYIVRQGLIDDMTEFTIKKPAKVTIEVNRRQVRTSVLQPGNYRILDLPFTAGLNEFVIKIEEIDGTVQVLRRIIPRENSVLPQGTTRYAISAGVSPRDQSEFLASGYLLFGLSPAFSSGIALQADKRSAMGGLTWAAALPLGTLNGWASLSGRWDGFGSEQFAGAAQMNYLFSFPTIEYVPSLGLSASYLGKGFLAPSLVPPSGSPPNGTMSISANLYTRLALRTGASIGISWSRSESTPPTASTEFFGSLSQSFSKGGNLSLSARCRLTSSGTPQLTALLMFTIVPKDDVPRSLTFVQPLDEPGSLSLNDRLFLFGRIFNFGLNASNPLPGSGKDASWSMNISNSSNYFEAGLSGILDYDADMAVYKGEASLQFKTTVLFVGPHFALSRQIPDSFVLVTSSPELKNEPAVYKLTTGSQFAAMRGGNFTMLLPSYRDAVLSVDLIEASLVLSPKIPYALISPGYRSGILFRSEVVKRSRITGRLVDASGKPVGYISGDIYDLGMSPIDSTFTDEMGNFEIYDLLPGTYKIKWPDPYGTTTVELREDAGELLELGDVKVP